MVRDFPHYSGVDDALGQVMGRIRPGKEAVAVGTEEAYGMVSAEDVFSKEDFPPFAVSHMDGYAVAAKDLRSASKSRPAELRIAGAAKLGASVAVPIRRGEAVWVATGSRIPSGADAVVPAELARQERKKILVAYAPQRGAFVYGKGEDVRRGERIISRGRVIRAQDVASLLGMGVAKVRVRAKPAVAVIATGSELTNEDVPRPGRIRNSHSPLFLALLRALGCTTIDLGIVPDDQARVSAAIAEGLKKADFVLTIGGTSVGRRDVVGEAVASLGPDLLLHGIRMDRGRVTGVAVVRGKVVLMMPGPIQGAMNAFVLFAVPIINLLAESEGRTLEVKCGLGKDWEARKRYSDFTKVVYVKLRTVRGVTAVPIVGETESVSVLTSADGYIVVPEDVTRMRRGSRATVRLLPGFSFA